MNAPPAAISQLKWRARPTIACLALSFCLPFCVCASPQDVIVQLVDARSGKPLSKVSVAMISWSGDSKFDPQHPSPRHERVETITNTEGRAIFHLAQPSFEHLGFMLEPPTDFFGCWNRSAFSPELVLRSGVVAEYDESKCGRLKNPVSAKPGEVIIFEKRLTWWEHLRRELP